MKEKDGIWYFNIKFDSEKGRRLKNKASVRIVPVHSFLISLGFLTYVPRGFRRKVQKCSSPIKGTMSARQRETA